MATLELGYMLRLANNNRGFAKRMLYVSRSGFFYDDRAAEKFDAGAGSLFAGNRRRLVYPTNAAE
ncbi:diguanylate cyclase [Klebsiella grimontii]|uniref:Diguanylate cyclase n=1 Tax=Klebsiella grimontii TaxID=2058152 RepID=A0A7H4P158_9ENTR|nr:diguanylate cyclase [Klebsiella grimontii]